MAVAPETVFDQARAEAFTGQMAGMLNNAGLALMTSIGHRTGLFDGLAALPPTTSQGLAEATGLQERYVREWLGAMVTGGIVELDETTGLYALPAEHAASLTREATPNNLAVVSQFISVLGRVEDDIVACFEMGGGVPYSKYPRFHQVMAEESAQTVVAALFDHILPLVPGLSEALERGIDVLDVGCGCGRALLAMAERFPKSRFVGYDFSDEAITRARQDAQQRGLKNARFEIKDVATLGDTGSFDLVTAFDSIHDQADPAGVLAGIQDSLRPDGTFLMQDIAGHTHHHGNHDQPLAPFMYTISCMHCMTVSLANGGAGLGAMWGRETAEQMLAEAGFSGVDVKQLDHDVLNFYYVSHKR